MFPGNVNPKKMKQMMKQMGMAMENIEGVEEVTIKTGSGTYVFDAPDVVVMTVQGIRTYQITGEPVYHGGVPEIPEEDVTLVASQTGVSGEVARNALTESRGDIAEAILKLTDND